MQSARSRVRWTGRAVLAVCALLAGPVAGGPSIARSETDLLTAFEENWKEPAALELALMSARDALIDSPHASAAKGLVVVSRDLPAGRAQRLAQLATLIGRGTTALAASGFPAPDLEQHPLLYVRVDVERGLPLRFGSTIAQAIFERAVKRSRPTSLPTLRDRADGDPMLRDVLRASDQQRLHQWNTASSSPLGPGSLPHLLARGLLERAGVLTGAPPWVRIGTTAWLEAQIAGDEAAAAEHLCADFAGATPETLAPLFEAAAEIDAHDVGILGRVVATLFTGHADGPARLATAQTDPAALDAAIRTVLEGLTPAAGPCDAEGGVACPICEGDGLVTAACAACDGVGKVLCSSCEGDDLCPAPYCWKGTQRWPGTSASVPCKYCNKKGDFKCLACRGNIAVRCKECRGSGETKRTCLACEGGRIPCPHAGVGPAVNRGRSPGSARPCAWCAAEGAQSACRYCYGIGYLGCDACKGSARILCTVCQGHGKGVTEYRGYPGIASWRKCEDCKGKGFFKCTDCRNGKCKCSLCKGKGVEPYRTDACRACDGTSHVPAAAATWERFHRRVRVSKERANAYQKAKDSAVAYLLDHARTSDGFAVTYTRGEYKGRLGTSSLFSNAYILWALSAAGVPMDDAKTRNGWRALKKQMRVVLAGGERDTTTQSVALGLRALILGGEEPDGELVTGAIELLTEQQRRNGFWNRDLLTEEDGDAFTSLFAIESLWIAHSRGAKVKSTVWRKALGAASRAIRVRGPTDMRKKDSYVTGVGVASNTALVIMAKAGTLGDEAGTFDYRSIAAVKGGLAWLDRYFDIAEQPVFKSGARARKVTDHGYGAYLFAIQRLAMLLNIADLGGKRWYSRGADELLARQAADGSIHEKAKRPANGPVIMTTAGLLFLVQATAPITGE